MSGLKKIFTSPSILLTDYIELGTFVDGGNITYEDKILTINIYRKEK